MEPSPTVRLRQLCRFLRLYEAQLTPPVPRTILTPGESLLLQELLLTPESSAAELSDRLQMDKSYLSRLLRSLEQRQLVTRQASPTDGRVQLLTLTGRGEEAATLLQRRTDDQLTARLSTLSEAQLRRLAEAAETVQTLLGEE